MNRTHWSIFLLLVVLGGIVGGAGLCGAGLLSAAAASDCCEDSEELDLCGDTCAACGSSGQTSPGDGDHAPAVILPHTRPVTEETGAALPPLHDGSAAPPRVPAHLSSTVLLR